MNNKPNYLRFEGLDAIPPPFLEDAWKALKKTIHEAAVSYENDCYLATTILCGKIIETLLKRAYYAEFREDHTKLQHIWNIPEEGLVYPKFVSDYATVDFSLRVL